MAYDITLEGTTVILRETTSGDYVDFDMAILEILRREKNIVINDLVITKDEINYPIPDGINKLKNGLGYDDLLTQELMDKFFDDNKQVITKQRADKENKMNESRELIANAKKSGNWQQIPEELWQIAKDEIVLTSSMFVAGREIQKEIDVISSECAYGMNIFKDLFTSVRDIAGGRSQSAEKVFRDARIAATNDLRGEALKIGAGAVISVDIDYLELSGGGKSGVLVAIATGTAVKLR